MPPRRQLIPSKERDEYIAIYRQNRHNEITVRCKERYIDAFLRFCEQRFETTDPKNLGQLQLSAFANHLTKQPILLSTATTQLNAILNWFTWLAKLGKIPKNSLEGVMASSFVKDK